MGGGRRKASDKLDLSVGFTKVAKSGEKVNTKTSLLILHSADKFITPNLVDEICDCFSISDREPEKSNELILQKVN